MLPSHDPDPTATATATAPPDPDPAARRRWMRTLALAPAWRLADAWDAWSPKPQVQEIRGPEAGLVMVRGRIDAAGDRFNLGEATVARATVRLDGEGVGDESVGTSYVLGGDLDHAWHAAVFDGLLTAPALRETVLTTVIEPLDRERGERDSVERGRAAATRVDFFTVSREHA